MTQTTKRFVLNGKGVAMSVQEIPKTTSIKMISLQITADQMLHWLDEYIKSFGSMEEVNVQIPQAIRDYIASVAGEDND